MIIFRKMKSTDKPAIVLKDRKPFASGGNRLCFSHPQNPEHCLKVIRPDRTPVIRKAEKRFPANLRPLSTFDENAVEFAVLNYLHKRYPPQITCHLPRSFGLTETDLGTVHETELIRDADGRISQTLEQYIWKNGINPIIEQAIQTFKKDWATKPPRTRDLIPHNFVVRLDGKNAHLVLIDGFGKKPSIRFLLADQMAKLSLKRRLNDFDYRIQLITKRKAAGNGPMHRINNLKR
jgi:hypothetical protein